MTESGLFTICLLITCLLCGQQSYASSTGSKTDAVPEHQLKAVYLIHLSEFTTWSDEKMQSPTFNVCIDAASDLVAPLNEVKTNGRLVKEKPLIIQHDLSIKNLSTCHIFYVDTRTIKLFTETQKQLITSSVLTVSSEEGFADNGGDIEYYLENDKVRMKANLKTIESSNLTMSSKVLQLMKIVSGF